jgi:Leucine-rich repeat (LRR) protein
MESIYLTGNNITDIHPDAFRGMRHLSSLSLESCNLKEVPKIFQNGPKLRDLNLDNNEISIVQMGTFRFAKGLQSLSLNKNPLKFTSGMFKGLETSLQKLELSETHLEKVPANALASLRNLRQLRLGMNRLTSIHTIFGSDSHYVTSRDGPKVEYDFSSNKIQDISASVFHERPAPALIKLNDNNLKSLDFLGDPCYFNGTFLMLHGNQITCSCKDYDLTKYPELTMMGACELLPSSCIDLHKDLLFDCACRKWRHANRFEIEKGKCPEMLKITTTIQGPDSSTPKIGAVGSGCEGLTMFNTNLIIIQVTIMEVLSIVRL